MPLRTTFPIVCALVVAGCTKSAPRTMEASREVSTATTDGIDPRAATVVREAFAAYRAWGRVDDEMRWAPFKCLTPMPGRPERSDAEDGEHARKLYSLFARDRAAYVAGDPPASAGQTIVKESFVAVLETEDAGAPNARLRALEGRAITDDHFDRYLREGDALYRAGELAAVFVMTNVRTRRDAVPESATDNGWIYGTLTPTGEVTSAGRVASCMGCHARAPHDRLFGPKTDHRPFGLAR